jgi:hypothetical protein
VGILLGRWWAVDGAVAAAASAVALGVLGALVTLGVLAVGDRDLVGWLRRRARGTDE